MATRIMPTFLVILLASTSAVARTFVVRPDGTGDFATIQAAFQGAAHGDTIALADGVFTGPGNRDLDPLQRDVVLRSESGDFELCTINAEYVTRCMKIAGVGYDGLVVEGITMTCGQSDGYPGQYGGAIDIREYCSPTFRNCAITHSTAASGGGGVYCEFSSPSFIDCLFKGNTCLSQQGGAMETVGYPSPELLRCRFSENAAWMGGGCVCYARSCATFSDCTFTDNVAELYGGGFKLTTSYSTTSFVTLTDCRFEGNHAGEYGGGAMTNVATLQGCEFYANTAGISGGGVETRGDDDHVSFDSCTFAENVAPWGAGLAQKSQSAEIVNCTFHANRADSAGAGISLSESGPVSLENTIISGSPGGCGVFVEQGSSLSLACCDIYGNEGGDWVGYIAGQYGVAGNISADPMYCNAPERDYTLHEDSPCAPYSPQNPACDLVGAWPTGCAPASVESQPLALSGIRFMGGLPNPTTGRTRLLFLASPGAGQAAATLEIFDLAGRPVRSLRTGDAVPGEFEIGWDGHDDTGHRVPAGIYLVRLQRGSQEATGRVVLTR